jgi:hypothetical protein
VFDALKDQSTVKLLEDVVGSVAQHLREMSALASGVPDDRVAESLGGVGDGRRREVGGQ